MYKIEPIDRTVQYLSGDLCPPHWPLWLVERRSYQGYRYRRFSIVARDPGDSQNADFRDRPVQDTNVQKIVLCSGLVYAGEMKRSTGLDTHKKMKAWLEDNLFLPTSTQDGVGTRFVQGGKHHLQERGVL